jgi:hypothetical protein
METLGSFGDGAETKAKPLLPRFTRNHHRP